MGGLMPSSRGQVGSAWPVGSPQPALPGGEAHVGAAGQTEKQGWDAGALPASSTAPLDHRRFPLSSSGLERAGAGSQGPWRRQVG